MLESAICGTKNFFFFTYFLRQSSLQIIYGMRSYLIDLVSELGRIAIEVLVNGAFVL